MIPDIPKVPNHIRKPKFKVMHKLEKDFYKCNDINMCLLNKDYKIWERNKEAMMVNAVKSEIYRKYLIDLIDSYTWTIKQAKKQCKWYQFACKREKKKEHPKPEKP